MPAQAVEHAGAQFQLSREVPEPVSLFKPEPKTSVLSGTNPNNFDSTLLETYLLPMQMLAGVTCINSRK